MKKGKHGYHIVPLLCFLLLVFAACSGKDGQEGSDGRGEAPINTKELVISAETSGHDIYSEAEELFRLDELEMNSDYRPLRLQYYRGEPVYLGIERVDSKGNPLILYTSNFEGKTYYFWKPRKYEDGSVLEYTYKLILFRADGTKETMIERLPVISPALSLSDRVPDSVTEDGKLIYSFDKREADYLQDSQWYLDRDGACYCWWDFQAGNNGEYTFMKITPSGEVAWSMLLDDDICIADVLELLDGRMYLILKDYPAGVKRVAEFDPDTGAQDGTGTTMILPGAPEKKYPDNLNCTLGTDGEGNVYLLSGISNQGIFRLNLSDGSVSEALSFVGTTYQKGDSTIDMTRDFSADALRVLPDGSVELLWCKLSRSIAADKVHQGIRETLRLVSADRPTVTLRAESFSDWMKKQASRFNRMNSRWQVVLEEYGSSNAVDLEEYARLTSVQIATGKGPAMLYGNFMDGYVPGMLEKGSLLELSGPLGEAGILEEDYLPLTFDVWRDGDRVYGITAEPGAPQIHTIDSIVLGDAGEPDDINTLVRALQTWEEDSALLGYNSPAENLRRFLQGSENLWGMVDWEKGTCDFSGDLFKGIMEVSKRYGYEESRKKPNLVRITEMRSIFLYMSREELDREGRTVCGPLYDDGCHGTVSGSRTLMVNDTSEAKEGALEFLCFLLDEDVQKESISVGFPVRRDLLEEWVRLQVEKRTNGGKNEVEADVSYLDAGEMVRDKRVYTAADMTEERIQDYLAALEDVRALPARNRPIIDIICEEAEAYFNGDKSVKEVAKVIKSKVGLYLAERR